MSSARGARRGKRTAVNHGVPARSATRAHEGTCGRQRSVAEQGPTMRMHDGPQGRSLHAEHTDR